MNREILIDGNEKFLVKLTDIIDNTFVLQFHNDEIFHQFNYSPDFLSQFPKPIASLLTTESIHKAVMNSLSVNPDNNLKFDLVQEKEGVFVFFVCISSSYLKDIHMKFELFTQKIESRKYTKVIKKLREDLQKAQQTVKEQGKIILNQVKIIEDLKKNQGSTTSEDLLIPNNNDDDDDSPIPLIPPKVRIPNVLWMFDESKGSEGSWKNFCMNEAMGDGQKITVILRTEDDLFGCYLGVMLKKKQIPLNVSGYFGSRSMKKSFTLSLNEGNTYIGSKKTEYTKKKFKDGSIVDVLVKDNYVTFFLDGENLGTAFHVSGEVKLCGTLFYKTQKMEIYL